MAEAVATTSPAAPARVMQGPASPRYANRMVLGAIGVFALLVSWELLVALRLLDPLFSSAPSRVFAAGVRYFTIGSGLEDLLVTVRTFSTGFFSAVLAGIVLGLLMGWFRPFEALIDPVFNFAYTSPRPALFPLFVIWFGIGVESKVALVFVSAIFPVAIGTAVGVKTVDRSLLNVARSFHGSMLQILRTVVLPSSVPHIVSGIRVALGHGLTAAVFGEMVVANKGLGYSMRVAGNNFDIDLVFCGFVVIGAIGVVAAELLRLVEKRLETWRPDIHR